MRFLQFDKTSCLKLIILKEIEMINNFENTVSCKWKLFYFESGIAHVGVFKSI